MEILNQLSSRQNDKTEESNRLVSELCINNPNLLNDIAAGFMVKDKKIQSDCMEVFTMVSESHPGLTAPFADRTVPLLSSKTTKTRWEAVHTLSLIADKVPDTILSILPELQELVEKDKSTIVRDYALDTVANFAETDIGASEKSFDLLKSGLDRWGEKHAKQVFKGFNNLLDHQPVFKAEIRKMTEPYMDAKKKVVAKEAKKVIRKLKDN